MGHKQPRVNYLNNKDILLEIQRSKNQYSSFTDPQYKLYDLILEHVPTNPEYPVLDINQLINNAVIETAKINRARRRSDDEFLRIRSTGTRIKQSECLIDPDSVPITDLIFRVMTWDHIPLTTIKKKTPRRQADHHTRVNFPPYQHWKYNANGELECVGKSHWDGDVNTGQFSISHGQLTPALADMMMKLCDRYATKACFRLYSYNDEMRDQAIIHVSQVGLKFDESKSNNPFAYLTSIITRCFVRHLNLEKRNQRMRDELLESYGVAPSYTRIHDAEYEAVLRRNDHALEHQSNKSEYAIKIVSGIVDSFDEWKTAISLLPQENGIKPDFENAEFIKNACHLNNFMINPVAVVDGKSVAMCYRTTDSIDDAIAYFNSLLKNERRKYQVFLHQLQYQETTSNWLVQFGQCIL